MEHGQLPPPAEELSRFALVPGALGGLSKTTPPRRKIRQVRLGAIGMLLACCWPAYIRHKMLFTIR